jgi:hypothetical protein
MSRLSMLRLPALAVLAVGVLATGCETGSTHENVTTTGAKGQNVGQNSNKSGPVPGSSTGMDVTANDNQQPVETTPPPANASSTPTK